MKYTIQIFIFLVAVAACSPAVYSTSTPQTVTQNGIEQDILDPINQQQYPCTLPNGDSGVQVCHVPPAAAPVDICAAIPKCTPNGGGDDDSSSDDNSSDDGSNDNSSDDHSSGDSDSGHHHSGGCRTHSMSTMTSRDHGSGGSGSTTGTTGGETCTSSGIPDDGGQNFLGKCSDVF